MKSMTNFLSKIKAKFQPFMGMHYFKCICCGADVFDDSGICEKCKPKIEFNDGKTCAKCGKPVGENDFCSCGKRELYFDRAYSPLIYDGLTRKAMLSYKFGGMTYIANTFSKMLADKAVKENIDFDVVTFVPLTKKDKRARGYNQTSLLANGFCDILKLPQPEELLTKIKQTQKQEKLDYKNRSTNLTGAFQATDKNLIKGKKILLIDDVITSGATTSECARVLKKNGADKVWVLTVAVRKENILMD